jgi:hypothetical protein
VLNKLGAKNNPPGSSVASALLRDHLVGLGCSPPAHPLLTRASPGSRELRAAKAHPPERDGQLGLSLAPPHRLQVNRGTRRFWRYKNPCRPHPPPRASRVSHHPRSPMLTCPHPLSPTAVRSTFNSSCAGPFLAPGQRGRNGLPRRYRFWVATHKMVD